MTAAADDTLREALAYELRMASGERPSLGLLITMAIVYLGDQLARLHDTLS